MMLWLAVVAIKSRVGGRKKPGETTGYSSTCGAGGLCAGRVIISFMGFVSLVGQRLFRLDDARNYACVFGWFWRGWRGCVVGCS